MSSIIATLGVVESPLPGRGRAGQSELAYYLKLPSSIILYSFLNLDVEDVFRVVQVCKRFAIHQSNQKLFKHVFMKRWQQLGLDQKWLDKLITFSITTTSPAQNSIQFPLLFPKRFFDWKWLARGFTIEIEENRMVICNETVLGSFKGTDEFYLGEWRDGKKNGLGLQYSKTGLYFGGWKDNQCDGIGYTLSSEGDTYFGEWKESHQHGWGKKKWVGEGDMYEGEWVKDDRHGHGEYTWGSSGARYTGGWLNGQISGQGVYHYSGGDCVYNGEWLEAKYNGNGILTFADGEYYKGTWQQDRKQGHFESRTSFGTRYVGEYVDDEFHGMASFTHPDGYTWSGLWSHNIPESEEAHHPKILSTLKAGDCSRTATSTSPFYGQLLYKCTICPPAPGSEKGYICANCAKSCHAGHPMASQKIWTVGRSFCCCSPCLLYSKKDHLSCTHQ